MTKHIPHISKQTLVHHPRNTFDRSGANRIAYEIERLWRAHGWDSARCRVEEMTVFHSRKPMFVVRSNLVDGLPPA